MGGPAVVCPPAFAYALGHLRSRVHTFRKLRIFTKAVMEIFFSCSLPASNGYSPIASAENFGHCDVVIAGSVLGVKHGTAVARCSEPGITCYHFVFDLEKHRDGAPGEVIE